jgi:hypothetical protein
MMGCSVPYPEVDFVNKPLNPLLALAAVLALAACSEPETPAQPSAPAMPAEEEIAFDAGEPNPLLSKALCPTACRLSIASAMSICAGHRRRHA